MHAGHEQFLESIHLIETLSYSNIHNIMQFKIILNQQIVLVRNKATKNV